MFSWKLPLLGIFVINTLYNGTILLLANSIFAIDLFITEDLKIEAIIKIYNLFLYMLP